MLFKKKVKETEHKDANYWISFTDLMTTLLIMVLLFSITQIVETEKRNKELEDAITEISVRTEIAEALAIEFENVDGIYINKNTGVVTLSEEAIIFEGGRYDLQRKSKEFLDWFFPRYGKVIMDESYSMFVKSIEIEGHTAVFGDLDHNERVSLSLNRAKSVYDYLYEMLDVEIIEKDTLMYKITPIGRGGLDLRNPEDPKDPINRRVEIHFVVDDVKIIEVVKQLEKE